MQIGKPPPHKCTLVLSVSLHSCVYSMCTNSVGSIPRYVFSKPLRAGCSILIRTVRCSADLYWAFVCSVLCSYRFGIGVFPCFTCHSVIWGDPGSSLGVGLSNDRQLLITDQQLDRNPSVSNAVIEMVVLLNPQKSDFLFLKLYGVNACLDPPAFLTTNIIQRIECDRLKFAHSSKVNLPKGFALINKQICAAD